MESILRKHFECIDDWLSHKDWGFMLVPLKIRPVLGGDLDAFLFTVKTMLPSDAKLVVVDGLAIRMSVTGEYSMVFASKQWARVGEGEIIPRLHPVELLPPPLRSPSLWDRIVPKRIREYIKGVALARSAGHSWRYSFYCARAFRFLGSYGKSTVSH